MDKQQQSKKKFFTTSGHSKLFKQEAADLEKLFVKDAKPLEQIAHYKILSELGAGGMGKVYKAHDPQTNRNVAIKVILPDRISVKARKRFMVEAKTMAKLCHANIVPLYNVATDATTGLDYMVMEFIEGENLSRKTFPPRQALAIIRDVALALHYAHEQGIIHRDLKPANLMLAKDNKVIVMDFGLAKNVKSQDLTQSGALIGTPLYMAPEQAASKLKLICSQTDVYALGAILYELLAGISAIEGETPAQIFYNILHNEIIPLQKHKPQLAIELDVICARAMVKEVDQRYSSAKAFADDIDRFLQGEIIQAQAFSLRHRIFKKLKKHKSVVAAIVLSLLMLVLGIYTFNTKQNEKVIKYFLQAKRMIVKLPEIDTLSDAKKLNRLGTTLEKYVAVLDLLRKVHRYGNTNHLMLRTYKSIGVLALAKKNYILSQSAFRNHDRLKGKDELINLLTKEENKDVRRLESIMIEAKNYAPAKEGQDYKMDTWVVEISRMRHPKVTRKLLFYIQTSNWRQRLLIYKSLGKLGDRTTKFLGKDSVDWLLERLKGLDPVEDSDLNNETQKINNEVEELIWALGWLKGSKAGKVIDKKRWKVGQGSLLWDKTKIPYKWIPLSKYKPGSAKAYNNRGFAKSGKGDFKGAITDYNIAISLNPKLSLTYNNRGIAYFRIKEYQRAIVDYTKAISLNPGLLRAYTNRGAVYNEIKEYQRAIVDYTKVISLNPKYSDAYNHRGVVYNEIKEHQKAIADYTKAISLNPNYFNAYTNRGAVYSNIKEYHRAIADYTKAIFLNPKLLLAYANRGLAYCNIKEYQRAIIDYTQAISLNPKYSDAYNNRGNVYKDTKKYHRAIVDYTKAISLNPKLFTAYYNRGSAYFSLKEYQKAIVDYTKTISLNPKFSVAYHYRGAILANTGKPQQAISDFLRYLQLQPNSPQAPHIYAYIRQHSK